MSLCQQPSGNTSAENALICSENKMTRIVLLSTLLIALKMMPHKQLISVQDAKLVKN